jgi:hypothetical protein
MFLQRFHGKPFTLDGRSDPSRRFGARGPPLVFMHTLILPIANHEPP